MSENFETARGKLRKTSENVFETKLISNSKRIFWSKALTYPGGMGHGSGPRKRSGDPSDRKPREKTMVFVRLRKQQKQSPGNHMKGLVGSKLLGGPHKRLDIEKI